MLSKDAVRGCLIGGAAGDALGYPVEFIGENDIFMRYGAGGIREYGLKNGKAVISDDTQMTLFTASGLILSAGKDEKAQYESIRKCYVEWLETQVSLSPMPGRTYYSPLSRIAPLYAQRAPGNTCINALYAGGRGTTAKPINNSKGCGGVMRVAPIGFLKQTPQHIARLGAEACAMTHGHPLGWLPGAAFSLIIYEISQNGLDPRAATERALEAVQALWADEPSTPVFVALMQKALDLAAGDKDDLTAIHTLGEGWVADEALAIAVYCAVKYAGDPDKTLIAAVNHKGDSDSTGAIAGNIVGAQAGLSGIPEKYIHNLELKDEIIALADELFEAEGWKED